MNSGKVLWPAACGWSFALLGVLAATSVHANGLGENGSWQFQSPQDKSQKAANVDLMERKKGGYYDSFRTTIINNSTTHIERQVNCTVSALTNANTGDNAMAASPSSPVTTSSGSNSATSTGNGASNGMDTGGWAPGGGVLNNNQSNTGTQSSGVSGSQANSSVGSVSAGGGSSQQSLNSTQSNSGTLSASVSGSAACDGPIFGTLN